jgi:hypothetical protein
MTPTEFDARILQPGIEALPLIGGPAPSLSARRVLLAVAIQESGLRYRAQRLANGKAGQARGWWQFESGGGVAGVMAHKACKDWVRRLCDYHEVTWEREAVWRALEGHDALAVGLARALLQTDPYPIPMAQEGAWTCYAHRLWRPGKPHWQTWPAAWETASSVTGMPA